MFAPVERVGFLTTRRAKQYEFWTDVLVVNETTIESGVPVQFEANTVEGFKSHPVNCGWNDPYFSNPATTTAGEQRDVLRSGSCVEKVS